MNSLDVMKDEGWYNIVGDASIDSITIFKDGEYSLFSQTRERHGRHMSLAMYTFNSEDIEGDSIYLSANFKSQLKDSANVYLGICQVSSIGEQLIDTIQVKKFDIDSSWFELNTLAKLDDRTVRILFFYHILGEDKLWTNNWHATIDNKPLDPPLKQNAAEVEDSESNKSSGITLETLTPEMLKNLEVLGKVWGFLKYYHPSVIQDKYNWDDELFRVLPNVVSAKDKLERSEALIEWIDGLGKFKNGEEFTIADPKKYSRIIDLTWLEDESIFDENLITLLRRVIYDMIVVIILFIGLQMWQK